MKTPLSEDARRRRRSEITYRYQKRRRREDKAAAIALLGGKCADCGYSACSAALDLHHRDPAAKEFLLSGFSGSRARLLEEVGKCVLLCASCHRIRHQLLDVNAKGGPVVEFRRRMKARMVEHMGRHCDGCGRTGPQAIFEFHHLEPSQKEFGLTTDGIPRRWERLVAELDKCVMLCACCHREVHAGFRQVVEPLLGLAESAASYGT